MLGILCGLGSEKKIASKVEGAVVLCSGARPEKARELARSLIAMGATKLMSFGTAGALDPSAGLGDVFVGTHAVSSGGRWTCDEVWGAELAARIPLARRGGVYGSERLVPTAQDKDRLFRETGCAIADMESQCLAEAAGAAGIPFSVVRAVCDNSSMNVPPFVMAAVREDGSVSALGALGHLILHPRQTPDLFAVMNGTNRALRSLAGIAGVLKS
ncbi:MAG: hypothetical protein PHE27_09040 [Alphaproteobacteria bacterium]|nr:hypothetical protein [Alphaproteobacteria bacterium]